MSRIEMILCAEECISCELVRKTREYYEREREFVHMNGCLSIPPDQVVEFTCQTLGVCLQELKEKGTGEPSSSGEGVDIDHSTPGKKRIKPSPVTGIDSFLADAIQRHVYEYYRRDYRKVVKLLASLKSAQLFSGGYQAFTNMNRVIKMKKKYAGDESENEFSVDEPEELQGSDDDWTPGAGEGRRQSKRLRTSVTKKPRLTEPSTSEEDESPSDEDSDSDGQFGKRGKRPVGPKGRGRGKKIQQVTSTSPSGGKVKPKADTVSCEATSTTISSPAAAPVPIEKEFTSGAFVVLKTDFQNGGDPPIWKIDGKALLQKYMPFEQDGKTLYKNTSTYSGWSINNKELYYPAPIVFKMQNRKETIVEFLKDSIKDVKVTPVESDLPHRDDSE